jgi:hypothetical protein
VDISGIASFGIGSEGCGPIVAMPSARRKD